MQGLALLRLLDQAQQLALLLTRLERLELAAGAAQELAGQALQRAKYSTVLSPTALGAGKVGGLGGTYVESVTLDELGRVVGISTATPSAGPSLPLDKSNGGFGQSVASGLTQNNIAYVDSTGAIVIGAMPWAALPTLHPGIVIPFQTVYVTASRWVTGLDTQYGSVSSGTGTQTDAYHLYLPASTTWRLEMITSYSYGGGGTLRASVLTASAWAGTYAEAAFVTTSGGGINSVFSTTLAVASPQVAIFNLRHSSSGINNVIMRFYQV